MDTQLPFKMADYNYKLSMNVVYVSPCFLAWDQIVFSNSDSDSEPWRNCFVYQLFIVCSMLLGAPLPLGITRFCVTLKSLPVSLSYHKTSPCVCEGDLYYRMNNIHMVTKCCLGFVCLFTTTSSTLKHVTALTTGIF